MYAYALHNAEFIYSMANTSGRSSFVRSYFGELFCRFYGSENWKEYLAKTSSLPIARQTKDFTFKNGYVLKASDINNSASGSCEREFALLLTSENIYNWAKKCGLEPSSAFSTVNTGVDLDKCEEPNISVDVKSTGCRFPISEISSKFVNNADQDLIEHSWSLSNSCGEFIDPNNVDRFKSITFEDHDISTDSVSIQSKVVDYLSYCLMLVDMSLLPSLKGEKNMMDKMLEKCLQYYATSTLITSVGEHNALLKGVIYDFIKEKSAYISSYSNNIKSFINFQASYAPVIEEVWKFRWLNSPPDFRLLFEFTLADLTDERLPLLNINDMQVVIGSQTKYLENVLMDSDVVAMREYISSLLVKANPSSDLGMLWMALHCYYGTYRTAVTRKVPRPLLYKPPYQLTTETVNFTLVESFFDKLQKGRPGTNVRRQFFGKLGTEAIAVFKKLRVGFPKISAMNVPDEYSYLNLDYYKHIPEKGLSEEEKLVLCNLRSSVDEMCTNRALSISVRRDAQRESRGNSLAKRSAERTSGSKFTKSHGLNRLKQRLFI
ncbi:CPh [Tobacco virus 1]|uniref:CPh n=1 Tax=Tobacco virus 1 TaxID=1692045 RepID=A0A0K1HRD7_9CLOS|nr:CPh [Tobacco virus 1]AKT94761.1 CPh [Tobacco virus 1]